MIHVQIWQEQIRKTFKRDVTDVLMNRIIEWGALYGMKIVGKDPAPVVAVSELADGSVNFVVRP